MSHKSTTVRRILNGCEIPATSGAIHLAAGAGSKFNAQEIAITRLSGRLALDKITGFASA